MSGRRHGPGFAAIPVLVACVAVGAYGDGCAGGHRGEAASTAGRGRAGKPVYRRRVNDAPDGDDRPMSPGYDSESNDDREVTAYGRAATAAEARAVNGVVRRFFAVAVASGGRRACSMIGARMVREIPAMGRAPNFRGKTCAAVMTTLLRVRHARLAREASGFSVTGVRVGRGRAMALLAFRATPERRYLLVRLEKRTWKLDELLDGPFP